MSQIPIDPATDSLSYWQATAEPVVPGADLPATADVVVIGGGMLGCWTTYWLARAGVPVVLLERTAIGWGATGRNGGFLVAGTALPYTDLVALVGRDAARALQQLTLDGRELAFSVVAEEGIDCDLRRAGTLSLTLAGAEPGEARYGGALVREDGFGSEQLDRAQVQEMIATPLGERIVGGSYVADDGLLHSGRYIAGIARAAERHGARLARAEVTSIAPHGSGSRIVTSAGTIDTGNLVIALNAWSDTLLPDLAGLVVPTRGQILAYEPIPPTFRTSIGVDVTSTGEYWQQTPDGSIVIGGCRADAPHADVGVREMVATPDVTNQIEHVLPELFPELPPLRVARRWAGLMAFTPDRLPIVDAVPSFPGAWVGGGFSGHGMVFGPRLGQLLAEAVTAGNPPTSLAPLWLDRPTLQPMGLPAPT